MKYDYLAWWSGGITSAIACKLALEHGSTKLVFIETHSHHPDTTRFKNDCEKWYGQEIEIWDNKKYEDHFDVILTEGWVNGTGGAKCTLELKKIVRQTVERYFLWGNQVFGYDYSFNELIRAKNFKRQHPHTKPCFLYLKGISQKIMPLP
jgi:hypothetical protein